MIAPLFVPKINNERKYARELLSLYLVGLAASLKTGIRKKAYTGKVLFTMRIQRGKPLSVK
jgi:hypothetical protein